MSERFTDAQLEQIRQVIAEEIGKAATSAEAHINYHVQDVGDAIAEYVAMAEYAARRRRHPDPRVRYAEKFRR